MKRKYKKGRAKRAKTSYESYLEKREEHIQKGYVLDPALSELEFDKVYANAQAKGKKNIVRAMANADKTVGYKEAQNLVGMFNKMVGNENKVTALDLQKMHFAGEGEHFEYYNPIMGEKMTRRRSNREALYMLLREAYEREEVDMAYGY